MHDFRQDLAVIHLEPCQPLTIQFRSGRGAFAGPDIAMAALPGGIVRALPAGGLVAKDQCQPNAVPIPRRREEEPVCRTGRRLCGPTCRFKEHISVLRWAYRCRNDRQSGDRPCCRSSRGSRKSLLMTNQEKTAKVACRPVLRQAWKPRRGQPKPGLRRCLSRRHGIRLGLRQGRFGRHCRNRAGRLPEEHVGCAR